MVHWYNNGLHIIRVKERVNINAVVSIDGNENLLIS